VQLTIYGRTWCHLCDVMRTALIPLAAEFDVAVEYIDIDDEPALVEQYDEVVPVLVLNGVELCRHHLDAERVRAALAGHL